MKKLAYIFSIFIVYGYWQTASATGNSVAVINATNATQTSTNENTQQKQLNSIKRKNANKSSQTNQNRTIAKRDKDKRRAWKTGDLSPSQVKKLQRSRSR